MRIVHSPFHQGSRPAPALDEFLARPLFAHLATLSPDGPRESPVWFLWQDEAVWIIANERDSFWKRVASDGRAALGIVDFDPRTGLVQHVGMRGGATVEPWHPGRARQLIARYLGEKCESWDERFRATVDACDNRFVRFVPETVVVRDQSYTP